MAMGQLEWAMWEMSPTETDMLDQPSTGVEKSAPSWRFPKLLGYGDAPGAGPDKGRGKTESRTPEERKRTRRTELDEGGRLLLASETLTADLFPAIRPATEQPAPLAGTFSSLLN